MNQEVNQSKYILFLLICYSFVLVFSQVCALLESYKAPLTLIHDYPISDWLINYQGGFVRRGLIGQLLYLLYINTSIDLIRFIIVFTFAILGLFSLLFINAYRKYKISLLLLPSFLLLGGFWNTGHSYLWFRRDLFIFLLIWIVFYCYKQIIDKKWHFYIPFYLFSIITILSHEASIFYMTFVVAAHFLFSQLQRHSLKHSFYKTTMLLLPSIITFFLCSCYKGSLKIANEIWTSWQPLFESLGGYNIPLGEGPGALTWKTIETFSFHITRNFFYPYFNIPSIFLYPFVFFAMLYLLVNISRFAKKGRPFFIIKFFHILLWQYIFMLPLFTVLSCDYRRLFLYWVISSFLFYFTIPRKYLSVFYHRLITFKIKKACVWFSTGIFANKWFYWIILLCSGTPLYRFSISYMFTSSAVGTIVYALSQLREIVF